MSFDVDPTNPWGGPTETALKTSTVDLLLRLVDSGRGLVSLMSPENEHRHTRIENLWKWHRKAESMIVSELGRRKRVAKQQKRELEELEGLPDVDEDEDEDEDDLSF